MGTLPQKLLLSGGGTGGHVFPALAIAEAFQAAVPGGQVHFVGATGGMEMTLVSQHGHTITGLPIAGLQRKLSFTNVKRNLALPGKLIAANRQAKALLKEFQPDLAIGTGGYASFPVLRAARGRVAVTAIQEQNAFPGLANRRLARGVDAVYLGMADAQAHFKPGPSFVVSGNPIRAEITAGSKTVGLAAHGFSEQKPVLFLTGGSLGARSLNTALEKDIAQLQAAGVQVLWQCGKHDYPSLKARLEPLPPEIRLVPFVRDMTAAYAMADVVICRAGAITLAELVALAKPAILVPSPNVTADHQTHNARSLASRKACILLPDETAGAALVPQALALLKDAPQRTAMRNALRALQGPPAAEVIVRDLIARFQARTQ